jgi:hypothetical protein
LQAVELEKRLRGEDCAGERTGNEHDKLRSVTDLVNLLDDRAQAQSAVENAADGFDGEEGKVAEVARKGDEPVT